MTSRKRRHIALGILGMLAAVIYLGPRPAPIAAIPPHEVDLPADLDRYLASKDAHLRTLRPDLARRIDWRNPKTKAQTEIAIVYLHSFSGSSRELSPVIEKVAEELDANVYFNRFSGHGQDSEALRGVRAEEWLDEANEALQIGRRLGKKVVVIGLSTGATLATWLAAHGAPMAAMVQVSPNFAAKDKRAGILLWPWGDRIVQLTNKGSRYREWEPKNDLQRAYWTPRQPVESLVTVMSLVRLVNHLDLSKVQTPTLVLYTEQDGTVSVPKIKETFARFGTTKKELQPIETSSHVLTGDANSPQTNDEVTRRITRFIAAQAR